MSSAIWKFSYRGKNKKEISWKPVFLEKHFLRLGLFLDGKQLGIQDVIKCKYLEEQLLLYLVVIAVSTLKQSLNMNPHLSVNIVQFKVFEIY